MVYDVCKFVRTPFSRTQRHSSLTLHGDPHTSPSAEHLIFLLAVKINRSPAPVQHNDPPRDVVNGSRSALDSLFTMISGLVVAGSDKFLSANRGPPIVQTSERSCRQAPPGLVMVAGFGSSVWGRGG